MISKCRYHALDRHIFTTAVSVGSEAAHHKCWPDGSLFTSYVSSDAKREDKFRKKQEKYLLNLLWSLSILITASFVLFEALCSDVFFIVCPWLVFYCPWIDSAALSFQHSVSTCAMLLNILRALKCDWFNTSSVQHLSPKLLPSCSHVCSYIILESSRTGLNSTWE